MGGSISIGIRYSTGEVRCVESWTNSTPWIFSSPELINSPDDWLHEQFDRRDLTPLAPGGYGLIFIDVVSKNLWSMQSYTSYGRLYSNSIGSELRHDPACDKDASPEAYNLKKLHEMGRVKGVRIHDRAYKNPISLAQWCAIDPLQQLARTSTAVSFDDIASRCMQYPDPSGDILIDIGFDVTVYNENADGSERFRQTLLNHGIVPDEKAWTQFNKEMEW